jgi:hypothetical protein
MACRWRARTPHCVWDQYRLLRIGRIYRSRNQWPLFHIFRSPLALNKAKYQVGRQHDFMLAAVSLNTRRAIPPEFNLMMTVDPEASDHYRFRGYLHIARTVTFLDQPFEVFRTAVSQAGAGHLYVDIYVNRSRLDASDALVSGATITGTLWLQGSLAV